ncbi:Spy0128 family protein [Thermoleophilum album]|uniref:Uncharacterized protein n=1 Tax=Thermoleophilum album TaxID=29539 RepID=A0A1H6FK66_THEAL|nr:FctA domain-containing protein [Thermoleophilum album]SEH10204.1 hypothetical protein SAMN02745716_0051 [Thermoleophilum album]
MGTARPATIRRALALVAASVAGAAAVVGNAAFGNFSAQTQNGGNQIATKPDFRAPQVVRAAVAKTVGFDPDFVRQGGSYYVYAQVSDLGNPPSGTASVTANVSSLTSGHSAVPLVAGSYAVGGQTYNYRSNALAAANPLAAGTYAFTIATADNAGNAATSTPYSVTVDNTQPQASDVQTQNLGATPCRAESGDTVTFTYSEPIDPQSILAGWDGSPTTVTVRIANAGTGDQLTVRNQANTTQLPIANTLNLGRTDYVTATRDFTNSTMQRSGNAIVVKLGTPSGAVSTAAGSGTMTWTVPTTGAYDRAGNNIMTGIRSEQGGADCEF